jgi:aspartyl-tRNA(Asn)/glutamyl-tRNA(Gln) amidotransferase subunit A
MLEVMAGPDDYDSTVSHSSVPAYSGSLASEKKYRIAYFNQAIEHPALDPQIAAGIKGFLAKLAEDGHTVKGIDVNFLEHIVPAYYILTTAEASSNLSRYDGVKFGHRTADTTRNLDDFYKKSRSEGFGKEVKRRIMLGTFVLSAGFYDAYFTRAQQVRQKICQETQLIFNDFDIIILPTSPTTAFKFGEKSHDAIEMFLADIFTVYANLAGIPGISFPLGKHTNGMPFGVQAMTNQLEELSLLQFSYQAHLRYL